MLKLTEGSLLSILKGETSSDTVLQIVGRLHYSVVTERGAVVVVEVSDGRYWTLAVLQAPPLLEMASAGLLHPHAVVCVQEYRATTELTCAWQEKWHILELVALEVVKVPPGSHLGTCKKFGSPIRLLWPANGLRRLLVPTPPVSEIAVQVLSPSILPLEALHPFITKSVICARVLSKSPLHWRRKPGGRDGQLFSMVLGDNTASVQATVFDPVALAFYDLMEVNRVYFVQFFLVKTANNEHASSLHPCELSLAEKSIVCEFVTEQQGLVASGSASIAPIVFNFVPLYWLLFLPENSKVDLIGVCNRAGELKKFDTNKTKACTKRRIYLVDHTNIEVPLTLWGREAEKLSVLSHHVVAVRKGIVEKYKGSKSVSVGIGASLVVEPLLPETELLKDWVLSQKSFSPHNTTLPNFGTRAVAWMTLGEAVAQRVEWFTCVATVTQMEARHCYKACARPNCRKRVLLTRNGLYRCDWCLMGVKTFKWCFPVQVVLADWTSSVVAEAVQREAQVLTGLSTEDRLDLLSKGCLPEALKKTCYRRNVMRLRCCWEEYEGNHLGKVEVVSSKQISARIYNRYLLSTFKETKK